MNDLASADPNIQTAMLEVISDGVSGGLLVYDKNDLIVFASQQLVTLLPVPKNFLAPGTRLRDFLGAVYDSGGRFAADVSGPRRMLGREDWIADRIATLWKERADTIEKRGTDRWLNFTKRRLSSGYGVCVIKDVSDHKKREEQWRADMERVQITEEVLDNLPYAITVRDSRMVFVAANKLAANFLDLPTEAILGRKGSDVYPPEVDERLDRINRQILELGEPAQLRELITRPDGSQVVSLAHKFRIGKPGRYYIVSAMVDITNLVEIDEDGSEVTPRISAGSLNRSKLTHRERPVPVAPQSDVSGRKVLLVSPDQQVQSDASRVFRGLQVDSSTVSSLEEMTLFVQLAGEAGISIDLVVVDAALDDRYVELARRNHIRTCTLDCRSAKKDLAALVSKSLTETTDIPVADASVEDDWQIMSTAETDASAIDILVAEDNEVNQIVFSQILEGFGYRYAIATDGEQAVKLWQERSPKLILMDVTLPKLTGFEASARIRAMETVDNTIPIIGVLAQAFDRDRDDCFASGMNDVILKPISPEALEAVFNTYIGKLPRQAYA